MTTAAKERSRFRAKVHRHATQKSSAGTNGNALHIMISDIATLANISKPTVWRLHWAQAIPGRVNSPFRIVRYVRSVVLAWLEAGMPDRAEWEASRT